MRLLADDHCRATPDLLAGLRRLALMLVLTAVVVTLGCHYTTWTQPVKAGPAIEPDGALRQFQEALRVKNAAGVGDLLARLNFRYRLPGEHLAEERIAFGALLVERLGPLFADGMLLTDEPEIALRYDELGYLVGGTAVVTARLAVDETMGREIALYRELVTTWLIEDYRWKLTGLAVDDRRLLPVPPEEHAEPSVPGPPAAETPPVAAN